MGEDALTRDYYRRGLRSNRTENTLRRDRVDMRMMTLAVGWGRAGCANPGLCQSPISRHGERSETALQSGVQILRCAQDDSMR